VGDERFKVPVIAGEVEELVELLNRGVAAGSMCESFMRLVGADWFRRANELADRLAARRVRMRVMREEYDWTGAEKASGVIRGLRARVRVPPLKPPEYTGEW